MQVYELEQKEDLAILHLTAGSGNALNYRLAEALKSALQRCTSARIKGLVLTGYDRFFSTGLDLIEAYVYDRRQANRFIETLDATMKQLFGYPALVVAAINGAATAGGCALALACDYRIMASEEGVIGMNEIRLGLPLPASALEVARFSIPSASLPHVIFSGRLFKPQEASALGMVHEVVPKAQLAEIAWQRLAEFTRHPGNAAATLKMTLRGAALQAMAKSAGPMREAFLDAWFSPAVRKAVGDLRAELLSKKQRAQS